MTEITRVKLQPIAKGSLTRLWLGLAAAVILAAGFAWLSVPDGVSVEELTAGQGARPGETDVVFVNYTGRLEDGTVFEESQPLPVPIEGVLPEGTPLPLENMIPGFREALTQMQRGGTYVATIPASKAYGDNPPPGAPIPPGEDLTFTIELLDFMSAEDFQQRISMIQQMMQQQQLLGPGAASAGESANGAASGQGGE